MKTYFISDVLDEDIVCPMGDEEHGFKYILARQPGSHRKNAEGKLKRREHEEKE